MVAPRINCVHTRFSYNTHISKMGSQMSFALLVATVASHQLFHCSNHGILSRVLMSMWMSGWSESLVTQLTKILHFATAGLTGLISKVHTTLLTHFTPHPHPFLLPPPLPPPPLHLMTLPWDQSQSLFCDKENKFWKLTCASWSFLYIRHETQGANSSAQNHLGHCVVSFIPMQKMWNKLSTMH